jgi:PhzF family phenazine biosynthesis protein
LAVPLYQVDAFTSEPFKGNPAAVCLLELEQPAEWMQNVAAEMNLAETAFLVPKERVFQLRWFTPTVEIPLCGHATLASAHILWETESLPIEDEARFETMSGTLIARRIGKQIEMDFPTIESDPTELPEALHKALGVTPKRVGITRTLGKKIANYLIELSSETEVRQLKPDIGLLRASVPEGVIVTARGETAPFDFVSRYFAPNFGVDEDPVTGSAHCALTPYWSRELGKTEMCGYQASPRGGIVGVRLAGERTLLSGEAVTILRGVLAGEPVTDEEGV